MEVECWLDHKWTWRVYLSIFGPDVNCVEVALDENNQWYKSMGLVQVQIVSC